MKCSTILPATPQPPDISQPSSRVISSPTPLPPAAVARLQQAFLFSGGDLPTLYRALVKSPEAWQATPGKFRTPWDRTVAALRATGATQLPFRQGATALKQQVGQPIWRPGSPAASAPAAIFSNQSRYRKRFVHRLFRLGRAFDQRQAHLRQNPVMHAAQRVFHRRGAGVGEHGIVQRE